MKRTFAIVGGLLVGFLVLTLSARATPVVRGFADAPPTVVVGTFDSRAIVVAYVRSDTRESAITELRAEHERAKADGDEARVAELEARGQALQEQIHRQTFGNAPVDDIIARIEDRLPDIARDAKVDVIVSKWVLAYRHPEAKFVDVTDHLAAEFDPDEATWKVIRELVATDPVPLDQLQHDH